MCVFVLLSMNKCFRELLVASINCYVCELGHLDTWLINCEHEVCMYVPMDLHVYLQGGRKGVFKGCCSKPFLDFITFN